MISLQKTEYSKNAIIVSIYGELAEKISKACKKSIICTYEGKVKRLSSAEDILKFLIAKDFYNYINFHGYLEKKNLYEKFITDSYRNKLLSAMDVPVCPYCNENYTYSIQRPRSKHALADLDHFYPKARYPEYALCLYNFIPACPICNSRFKSSKNVNRKEYIYPYEEGFSDCARFKIMNLLELKKSSEIVLGIEVKDQDVGSRISKNIDLFKIKQRYDNHLDVVRELYERSEIYKEEYISEISNILKRDTNEVKEDIFGSRQEESEFGRISLGKLRHDIVEQLGIYQKD